ncbi:hypothetical protein FRC10_008212 [Ceratobasidium sp. 414]|nr:hypothetical protein FRC10_008212 [Ceratobasidium sp. 414]
MPAVPPAAPLALMNTQTSIQPAELPFFDPSAKRVKLPQPKNIHRTQRGHPITDNTLSGVHRRAALRPSHSRTPSSDTSYSSASEADLSFKLLSQSANSSFTRYTQCYTPEMSRSPSPNEQVPMQTDPISVPTLALRSPPMTPPTIHAILPPSAPISNYRLRLEPIMTSEPPQAVVVFPDAATPTRALLLLGPAIARHIRERGGKAMRMHPYRVVLRPSA